MPKFCEMFDLLPKESAEMPSKPTVSSARSCVACSGQHPGFSTEIQGPDCWWDL